MMAFRLSYLIAYSNSVACYALPMMADSLAYAMLATKICHGTTRHNARNVACLQTAWYVVAV